VDEFFAPRRVIERRRTAVTRPSDGVSPAPHAARIKAKPRLSIRNLFDFLSPQKPVEDDSPTPTPEQSLPETVPKPASPAAIQNRTEVPVSPVIASGEKAKARDILAAIRTLKTIEREQRAATAEERQTLAKFAGFGPVALSIFPDPVKGHYKDAGWESIGKELTTLLSADEYDSAKRTTFNAFYTSPTVISGIHEAISRLGIPGNALVMEPGCGIGNFMSQAREGMRFIGVELDSISGRIARAIHPEADIRIESFRDTNLPEDRIDAVIGNVPFADLKLDYQGQKLSLHDFFFAKSIDALKTHGVLAMVTTHFTLDKLCGRPHNLSFVVLSVMWRPMATFKAHSRLGILNAT
jgi:hypothetical protein